MKPLPTQIGRLTIVEDLGEKGARLRCVCGTVVKRSRMVLTQAINRGADSACKKCGRKSSAMRRSVARSCARSRIDREDPTA